MTNHYTDIGNADAVLIIGSNAAEHHPISFRWVLKAKEKGATVIHVDPKFSRTSARSSYHVPLRSGTDIAFMGGMCKYILDNKKYFNDYVMNYTNATFLVGEKYSFTDGLFSGFDQIAVEVVKVHRVLAEGCAQRGAGLHIGADVVEQFGDAGIGVASAHNVEGLQQGDAGLHHGGELACEDGEILGLDGLAGAHAALPDLAGQHALATQGGLYLVFAAGTHLAAHGLAVAVLAFPFEGEFFAVFGFCRCHAFL